MAKLGAGAVHDGQAQPHAGAGRSRHAQTVELLKDALLFALGNTGASVPDLEPRAVVGLAPRPHDNAARFGIADGIRHEVLQDAAQVGRVAFHHLRRGQHAQVDPLGSSRGRVFVAELAHHGCERNGQDRQV